MLASYLYTSKNPALIDSSLAVWSGIHVCVEWSQIFQQLLKSENLKSNRSLSIFLPPKIHVDLPDHITASPKAQIQDVCVHKSRSWKVWRLPIKHTRLTWLVLCISLFHRLHSKYPKICKNNPQPSHKGQTHNMALISSTRLRVLTWRVRLEWKDKQGSGLIMSLLRKLGFVYTFANPHEYGWYKLFIFQECLAQE